MGLGLGLGLGFGVRVEVERGWRWSEGGAVRRGEGRPPAKKESVARA